MVIGLLSLLGMPPTVGFMAKAVVFSTAVDQGMLWLAVIAVVNTVIAAYYYLRVAGIIVFGEPKETDRLKTTAGEWTAVGVGVVGAIALGVVPWLALNLVEQSLTIL